MATAKRVGLCGLILLVAVGGGLVWWFGVGGRVQLSSDDPHDSEATVSRRGMQRLLGDHLDNADPANDGWDSEKFSEAAGKQLKSLAKLAADLDTHGPGDFASIVADDFSCQPLRPTNLKTVLQNSTWTVSRWKAGGASAPVSLKRGAEGLVEALRELTPSRVKFKIVRVGDLGQAVSTALFVESTGNRDGRRVQHTAQWNCRWRASAGSPLLQSIDVVDFEEVVLSSTLGEGLLSDCTEAAVGHTACYGPQLLRGQGYWARRVSSRLMDIIGHSGLAIGDANGDGLEDVYVCQPAGLPNRLFLHQPDGTVRDASRESGLDWLDYSRSALFLDFDNDGDQDLAINGHGLVLLLRNDGRGRFGGVGAFRVESGLSMAAVDYNNDGRLDIYICCYPDRSPVPYYDAENGVANHLFRNDGGWRFSDVTNEVGLDDNNNRFSFAAGWEDYDNDGDLDLYVANDYGRNNLYRNDGGRFVDVAASAGVEDMAAGMGVAWADYNRDGWMDVYVSNMFSSAGNRVTFHRRFEGEAGSVARAAMQRHARGNSLFSADGSGGFKDVSVSSGVTMGRWSWDTKFADIDNDGREDLLVANGYITNDDPHDL